MGKDRRVLSIKEVMNADNESFAIENERMPRYIIKPPKFSCPLSPDIMWHHDLQYASCPLCESERDMLECEKCKHRGDGTFKAKRHKKHKHNNKKDRPKVEKSSKESIPKIGKTYVSE